MQTLVAINQLLMATVKYSKLKTSILHRPLEYGSHVAYRRVLKRCAELTRHDTNLDYPSVARGIRYFSTQES
jgi:hypothetical protein